MACRRICIDNCKQGQKDKEGPCTKRTAKLKVGLGLFSGQCCVFPGLCGCQCTGCRLSTGAPLLCRTVHTTVAPQRLPSLKSFTAVSTRKHTVNGQRINEHTQWHFKFKLAIISESSESDSRRRAAASRRWRLPACHRWRPPTRSRTRRRLPVPECQCSRRTQLSRRKTS